MGRAGKVQVFSGLRSGGSRRGQCGCSWTPRRHLKGLGAGRAQGTGGIPADLRVDPAYKPGGHGNSGRTSGKMEWQGGGPTRER